MSKFVMINSSKYRGGYFGLKLKDKCIVVGTRAEYIVVYRPFRDIKTNLRPLVVLKNDCTFEYIEVNFFYKQIVKLIKWLVVGAVNQVNTKGITPYRK